MWEKRKTIKKLEGKRMGVITSIMVIILLVLATIVQGINVSPTGIMENKKSLSNITILETCNQKINKEFIPHDPIYINGNENFTAENGVTGGNGTKNDPYIIEGWDIDASSAYGIKIQNTDAHFAIRECCIHSKNNTLNVGIPLDYVQNGCVENCELLRNLNGINLRYSFNNIISKCTILDSNGGVHIDDSSHSTITDCTIQSSFGNGICLWSNNNYISNCTISNNGCGIEIIGDNSRISNCEIINNGRGIYMDGSSNNSILKCDISENDNNGLWITSCSNITLRHNILNNNGYNFGIWGHEIGYFYHDIDSSNTINGKPLYYIIGKENLKFNESMKIGYLGLVSCKNISIKNLDTYGMLLANTTSATISHCTINNGVNGILLQFSSNIRISNCSLFDNDHGIEFYWSSHNKISSCNISKNRVGIRIWFISCYNQLSNCIFHMNNAYGIELDFYSTNNKISNCTVSSTKWCGIYLVEANSNYISSCIVSGSSYTPCNDLYGIHISYSSSNKISNCICYGNYKGISLTGYSKFNRITNCTSCNNSKYGIYLYWGSENNQVTHCNIRDNRICGAYIRKKIRPPRSPPSINNIFHHNNFIDNGINAYDSYKNYWDDGNKGNYWSNYLWFDLNNDGIGGLPKYIFGGFNWDMRPLMEPYEW